ncbi:MAG TPA: hypothetical protein DD379_07360 [Cyanobacteria bacterium UBA11162]|nr:hypothetical protein [Cyanobacteria bacterium UBA11162]
MTRVILLDTGPLGQVTHPRMQPQIGEWLRVLKQNSIALRVPEIADYELRRELLRSGKQKSIERLNKLGESCLIPLTPQTMQKAAELWAWVRNQGQPTASKDSLDGDVILIAQAIMEITSFEQVVVTTTNLNHLSRFSSKGITILDWEEALSEMSY